MGKHSQYRRRGSGSDGNAQPLDLAPVLTAADSTTVHIQLPPDAWVDGSIILEYYTTPPLSWASWGFYSFSDAYDVDVSGLGLTAHWRARVVNDTGPNGPDSPWSNTLTL
jgi:hypothetical protein